MRMRRIKDEGRRMNEAARLHPSSFILHPWAGGFTLVEVLATLALLAIVLPVAMRGISTGLAAADSARHVAEASALAQTQLNEIVTSGQWLGSGASGDFGADWPAYRWTCQTTARDYGLTEIVVTVSWTQRGRERSVNVATLVLEQGVTQ